MAEETTPKEQPIQATAPATTAAPADDTRPEEKALADKLMQELKASGVNVDEMAKAESAPAPTDTTLEKKQEVKPEAKPENTPEPAKKKLSFPKLFAKKTPQPDTPPEKIEAVDSVTQQITNEALMEMIDEKIQKISGDDFLTIKLSKQGLLAVSGVALLLVWIIPFISHITLPDLSSLPLFAKKPAATLVTEIAPSPTPEPKKGVRIRMGSDSLQAASELKQILQTAGIETIDVVHDSQVNPNVFMVATREDAPELKQQLVDLFDELYKVASETASLTSDSDFAATLLVGKNSKK